MKTIMTMVIIRRVRIPLPIIIRFFFLTIELLVYGILDADLK
jgi:hypothetical protein